jgi:imidazolonepropionase-like amidohydrolase
MIISGATIIDGRSATPIEGQSIWVEGRRIKAVGRREEFRVLRETKVINAHGKYVIPGLMNANVHLLIDLRLENLARHAGHFEDLIAEAAQVALRGGLTTVFDTAGPRGPLIAVRDRIENGALIGSRIFCAGWIIGFDGPFSEDFYVKAQDVASAALTKRINALWVENVGRHLMWLTPDQVGEEVRAYIGRGVNFIKFASNAHFPGSFLTFSPQAQTRIVQEARHAGITAQAHTMSVEGLRVAIEAGCDLIQHANVTGPIPIPDATMSMICSRKTGMVVFPFTQRRLDWVMEHVTDAERTMWQASDMNARKLIEAGATLLLANDGGIFAPEMGTDTRLARSWSAPGEDNLIDLGAGHFAWLKAMEEKGCPPIEMLRAATRNIAVAYGMDKDLGTLEPGKVADMIILDKDPLRSAENYRSINSVIKDGKLINRDALPTNPILTKAMEPASEAEAVYVPFLGAGGFPPCPMCMRR